MVQEGTAIRGCVDCAAGRFERLAEKSQAR
jgi:hypothetical protein